MITIVARWTLAQENLKTVMENLNHLVEGSRKEAGNICYQPYHEPGNSLSILIFEQYRDAEAIEAHRASSHFRKFAVERIVPLLATREIQVLQDQIQA